MCNDRFYSFYNPDEQPASPTMTRISTSCPSSMARNPYKMAGITNPALTTLNYIIDIKVK